MLFSKISDLFYYYSYINNTKNEYDLILFMRHDIQTANIPTFIEKIGQYSFSDKSIEKVSIPKKKSDRNL